MAERVPRTRRVPPRSPTRAAARPLPKPVIAPVDPMALSAQAIQLLRSRLDRKKAS